MDLIEWKITTYANAFDNRPSPLSVTFPGLIKALTSPQVVGTDDKRNVRCWSAASYPEGATRLKANVVDVSMLVLDVDDGTPAREFVRPFSEWPYIVHTSWSHTEAHPRYRVVLPLEVAVAGSLWGRVFDWARQKTGGHIDEACKDPSRLWFRPAVRDKAWPFLSHVHDPGGQLLGLDAEALPMTSEEAAIARAKTARPPPPVRDDAPDWKRRQAAQDRLKVDPAMRQAAAIAAGGKVAGNRANKIPCPSCGRPSVWMLLVPDKFRGCRCNHGSSCGWAGWVDELPGVDVLMLMG